MIVIHTLAFSIQTIFWPFTYWDGQVMKWAWLISMNAWKYTVFIAVLGPIWIIIALVIAGTEAQKEVNAVTWEISWTILIYMMYEAVSVYFVWKYVPYV